MSAPKSLSPETEAKLLAAVEKTADYVADGLSPNNAVAKAAADCGIPRGTVHLIVHAYNTGRTTRQRLQGQDTLEKVADFELADTEEVLKQLYPETVKTAAQIQRETVIDPSYSRSPREIIAVRDRPPLIKAAHAAPRSTLPHDPIEAIRRADGQVQRLRRDVEELRAKAAAARDKFSQTLDVLTDYFRGPAATPFQQVRETAGLLFGDAGTALLSHVDSRAPWLTKFARSRVVDEDATAEPYITIRRALAAANTCAQLQAQYTKQAQACELQAGVLLAPFVPKSRSVLDRETSWTDTSGKTEKQAGPISGMWNLAGSASLLKDIGTTIGMGASLPKDTAALTQSQLATLTDPEHEAKLRALNTQANLTDLITTDPVLKGYHPDEITDAFNDLTQLSPRIADQKLLLQAALRKRLQQGSLDQFDLDQMLGIEDKLRKRDTPAISGVGADGSVL